MPIYEYQCKKCGYKFEKLQKISDKPLVECPECKKPELEKLVSAAGFQLKGSGWYVTDFKDKGKKSESKKAEAKSEKKETKKNEEKPKCPATGKTCERCK